MSVCERSADKTGTSPTQTAGGRDKESGSDDVTHPAGHHPASERPSAGGRGLRRPGTPKGPQNSEQDRIQIMTRSQKVEK